MDLQEWLFSKFSALENVKSADEIMEEDGTATLW
jgi:hypothetical protein